MSSGLFFLSLPKIYFAKKLEIKDYTLKNINNISVKFLNFGGIITEINIPDKNSNFENIVLNYPEKKDYLYC